MPTVLLLIASNCFMNLAWYGHLQHRQLTAWMAILVSWLIALPEYCLAVPANRLGKAVFTLPQLKVLQEAISLGVFFVLSTLLWKEPPRWQDLLGAGLVVAGVTVAMLGRSGGAPG